MSKTKITQSGNGNEFEDLMTSQVANAGSSSPTTKPNKPTPKARLSTAGRTRGPIWNLFHRDSDSTGRKWKCNLCLMEVSGESRRLKKHYRSKHLAFLNQKKQEAAQHRDAATVLI